MAALFYFGALTSGSLLYVLCVSVVKGSTTETQRTQRREPPI